ncbi:MAG: endonuclease/exonuclease/phosphatase family protein [Pseudomonadota bacterium]
MPIDFVNRQLRKVWPIQVFPSIRAALALAVGLVLAAHSTSVLASTLSIGAVQGPGHKSPLVDKTVTVEGVITSLGPRAEFTIQGTPDGDPKTSDALAVRYKGRPGQAFDSQDLRLAVGDRVTVTGKVIEDSRPPRGRTVLVCGTTQSNQIKPGASKELTLTKLDASSGSIKYLGSGKLPDAVSVPAPGQALPKTYDDDGLKSFDPNTDFVDYLESLESMRVKIGSSIAIAPLNRFSELWVQPEGTPGVALADGWRRMVTDYSHRANRLLLSLPRPNFSIGPAKIKAAAKIAPVEGIVSYSFGAYKILLGAVPQFTDGKQAEPKPFKRMANHIVLASYNVANFDLEVESTDKLVGTTKPDDDVGAGRLTQFADHIANFLGRPDLVVLQEVQDNDGATVSTDATGTKTGQALVAAIKKAGGPAYSYGEVAPKLNCDGGQPGGNIRSAFLFNPESLTLVSSSVIADPATTDNAFKNSRKPLVGVFRLKSGKEMTVIAVHLASKGSDDPLQGNVPNPQRKSEKQRLAQAKLVRDFADNQVAQHPERTIVVVGDFNDYYFSPTLERIKGKGKAALTNLVEQLPEKERWTYIFKGQAQALDHVLVGGSVDLKASNAGVVRLNASRLTQASDHDPIATNLKID